MPTRRRAREIVLQLLYEDDLNPEQDVSVAERFLAARLLGNRPLIEFAKELWKSVIKNRWEIDKALSAKAKNWSLRRMAAIDRNILRLGAFEILHTDTPGRVVINEAVELAKRYGNQQSGQFVNGILDRILHQDEDTDDALVDEATDSAVATDAESTADSPAEAEGAETQAENTPPENDSSQAMTAGES